MDTLTEVQKGYIAGFFDGEGCATIHALRKKDKSIYGYTARIEIANREKAPLELIQTYFSGSIFVKKDKNPNGAPFWRWRLADKTCIAKFVEAIRPYVLIKGPALDCLLEMSELIRMRGYGSNQPVPQSVWEAREACRLKMQNLNKKGPKIDSDAYKAAVAKGLI